MVENKRARDEIVEYLPVGVMILDREMRVVHLNPAAQEMIGCAPAALQGKCLSDLFDPGLWADGSALQQAVASGERVAPQVTTVSCSAAGSNDRAGQRGQRRFLVSAAPADVGFVLSLHPASPFYEIEADWVSDLSHDLRAPLASIRAYTELLMDEVDEGDSELRQQFLEVIEQRSCHLTTLIVNLTGLVRWALGHLEMSKMRVSLRQVAGEAIASFRDLARRQEVRLRLDGAKSPHPVWADHDALSTLLKNVLSNAIKFSPTGGTVIISLRRAGRDQIVEVTDSGCGIAPEDLPHIFETFYRGRNAVAEGLEGAGLGLALARVIVEAHGGKITVTSEDREGTRVTITLPALEALPGQS